MVNISPITSQENVLAAQLSCGGCYIPLGFNESNLQQREELRKE